MKKIFTLLTFALIAMNVSAQMTTVAVRYNLADDLVGGCVDITVPALEFSVNVPLTTGSDVFWLSAGATAGVCAGLADGSQITHSRLFGDLNLNLCASNAVTVYGGAGFGVSNTVERKLRSSYAGNGARYSLARAQAGATVSLNGWGVNVNVSTDGVVGFGLVISIPSGERPKASPSKPLLQGASDEGRTIKGAGGSMRFYRDARGQLCVAM